MDDIGTARGPLLDPDMWREQIRPHEQRLIDSIHENGIMVTYHSCGCVEDFIPDLIEMGVDVMHPLQGGVNDQETIESLYHDQMVFDDCEDTLVYLPETSEEDLRKEMRRIASIFAEHKNILWESISFIPRNREIMLDEARKIIAGSTF